MLKKLSRWGSLVGLASMFSVAVAFGGNASAATVDVACEDLATAVASASAGDTLQVTGDCVVTSTITLDKQLTLVAEDGATITTSGSNYVFRIAADGVVINNFDFVKTDKATQNIIGIQADDATVTNSSFEGQYTIAANDHTSRAIEVSPGVTGFEFSNNTVMNLRQPAYINGTAEGIVANNYVDETRGFVVEAHSDVTFIGNTWGTNVVDIAIIPGSPNNYPCEVVRQIVRNNDNADVIHQAQTETCPTYPTAKEQCKDGGFRTFTAVAFKNQGQCVSYLQANSNSVPANRE